MKLSTLVFRELLQRKQKFLASTLAIALGIAAIVMMHTLTTYSEKAVTKKLDALGANVLILPPEATLNDYYSADFQTGELPEEYVTLLTTSNLEGLDNLSPKLTVPVNIQNVPVTLTGILPKNEFSSKAAWQGAGIFCRPKSCGSVNDIFGLSQKPPKETLVRKRVIDSLDSDEVLVGHDVAKKLKIQEGSEIALLDNPFKVSAVLPQTGTIDDSRVFAHLHTVQDLTGKGPVVNAIEVVGCCEQISKGLVAKITTLIPDAKIVTISQIVDTQVRTNQLMKSLSTLFLIALIILGGAGIANDMYNNVYARKKEIGTLVALGADSSTVLKIFLLKALILGVLGGVGGFILGTVIAIVSGPLLAGVPVLPLWQWLPLSLGLALAITLVASYFPARYATRLDPSCVLQEI